MLACLLSLGFIAVGSGCSDSDFDLSNIDTTIGIGGDGLELPTSSTENIVLDDILSLNNSDFVVIKENGDYFFIKDGEGCTPSHPHINRVYVNQTSVNDNFKVNIELPSSVLSASKRTKRRVKAIDELSFEGKIAEFSYLGKSPKEIKAITTAGVSSAVAISVIPSSGLKSSVPTFKTMTLTVPSFMVLDITSCSSSDYTYDMESGKITLRNVSSSAPIYIKGVVNTLDFTRKATADNKLVFTAGKDGGEGSVKLDGIVKTGVTFDGINVSSTVPADLSLSASMTMGQFTIMRAKGRFAPDIDLGEIGNVDINGVPDFLSGSDVSINLHNPAIDLVIKSNIAVAGKVKGKIVANDKDGHAISTVSVPEMTIKPHAGGETASTETRICICKNPSEVDKSQYDEVVEVSNLSDLVMTIPNSLHFEADAHADDSKDADVELGTTYEIAPHYSFSAPLSFDEGAQIVYRDTLDGWHDDIEDYDLMEGSRIELNADIDNKIPAFLNVEANAIGLDGQSISADLIEVVVSNSVRAAAGDGSSVTTPITITLREKKVGALKDVDGLAFKVKAASGEGSESIVGKTLNAYKHTLTARNIKVKLVGKIIADL